MIYIKVYPWPELYILDTHESLCSGTTVLNHMSKTDRIQPSQNVPSPPIWGCLVMTMDCRAGEGVGAFPLAPGLIHNHRVTARVSAAITYLRDHDGSSSRARDCGASHFATSRVERRDQVHAGLRSHIALGGTRRRRVKEQERP